MFCGSGGPKSRLPKVAGAEPSGEMRDEKLHPIVARSKSKGQRSYFASWSWDVEKAHADVARSTFRKQNVKNTMGLEHFWKLRCWKRHGVVAGSTFPSQNGKTHTTFGLFLDVRAVFRGRGNGFRTFWKVSPACGFCNFCSSFQNDGRRRRSARDISIRHVRMSEVHFVSLFGQGIYKGSCEIQHLQLQVCCPVDIQHLSFSNGHVTKTWTDRY